jgi:hypothetical protein
MLIGRTIDPNEFAKFCHQNVLVFAVIYDSLRSLDFGTTPRRFGRVDSDEAGGRGADDRERDYRDGDGCEG